MSERNLNILFFVFLIISLVLGVMYKYFQSSYLLFLSVMFAFFNLIICGIWVVRLVKMIFKAFK